MTDPNFFQPGYVVDGYVEQPVYSQVVTDNREYRRGRIPGDWFELYTIGSACRVEGVAIDLNHRNVLRMNGCSRTLESHRFD